MSNEAAEGNGACQDDNGQEACGLLKRESKVEIKNNENGKKHKNGAKEEVEIKAIESINASVR